MPMLKGPMLYAMTSRKDAEDGATLHLDAHSRRSVDIEDFGVTSVNTERTSFAWTINDFMLSDKKPGECLESPVFPSKPDARLKWKLQLYPRGTTPDDSQHVSVFLCLASYDGPEVEASYKFSVLNAKRRESRKRRGRKLFVLGDPEREAWGASRFVSRAELKNKKNGLLLGEDLTILCRVTAGVSEPHEYESIDDVYPVSLVQYDELCPLARDLGLLLAKQSFSDVSLVSRDGRCFRAHRNILAARSSVLAAMLQHDLDGNQSNVLNMDDLDGNVLKELLNYVYTGRVWNTRVDIRAALRRYAIEGLPFEPLEKDTWDSSSVDSAVDIFSDSCSF